MKTKMKVMAQVAVLVLASALNSQAIIAIEGYWRLGESDPGAVNGGVVPDNAGALNTRSANQIVGPDDLKSFTDNTTPTYYSNSVASGSVNPTGSTLSAQFAGGAHLGIWKDPGGGGRTYDLTNNFGLELWVKSGSATGTQFFANNGSGSQGWGIFQQSDGYKAIYSNTEIFGTDAFGSAIAPVTVGVWTHLALVRDSGISTFYVNGVATGTTSALFSGTNNTDGGNTNFTVGAITGGVNAFTGNIDEVRIFTFTGPFDTSDLLFAAVPEPTTYVMLLAGLLTLFVLARLRKSTAV
jgi:hypothetical protein